jgi:signal transduction histidine kinase
MANGRGDSAACSLLIVVDSESDAARWREHLTSGALAGAETEHARDAYGALARLESRGYDAVLLDMALPDTDGLETLDAVTAVADDAAIIVLTESDEEWLAGEAVRRGAQDHLIKGDRRTGHIASTALHAIRRQRVFAELKAARIEQLAQKDRFLSHVSHELRSPLAVVYQFASLLADGIAGPLSEAQADLVNVVMRNADQLKLMIDDLLQVSHAKRDKVVIDRVVFAPSELVDETVFAFRPIADERKIALACRIRPVPDVIGDPRRVRQIVGNLIDNAIKFTPPGGRIEIATEVTADAVRISVSDTGRGLSREDLPHIFEQFFQGEQSGDVSRNGLGLGLYVCRDLVTRQGGTIEAASEPGLGTSISFTLPIQRQPALTEVPA